VEHYTVKIRAETFHITWNTTQLATELMVATLAILSFSILDWTLRTLATFPVEPAVAQEKQVTILIF